MTSESTQLKKWPVLATGILGAFCVMIILLITSVEAVAYWTPGYYEQEYTKYHVLEDLPEMAMEDLLAVTDEMMAYLRGNREDLHVSAVIGGETREFFNAREIAHMEDVRGLFLGGLMLRRICILILLLLAAFFWGWSHKKEARIRFLSYMLPSSLSIGTGLFFLLSAGIAGIISTDFSKYFVVFHQIFFDNDLWILNPATDLLINIVPEPFFMDTAIRIGLLFAAMTVLFLAGNLLLWKRNRKKNAH